MSSVLPPPHYRFSIPHVNEERGDPDNGIKPFIVFTCRLEITYPRGCGKTDVAHVVLRRWSHFTLFDIEWARFYPQLHDQIHITDTTSLTDLLSKTKLQQAHTRKSHLEWYVNKLLTVACLQEFVAQFLALDAAAMRSADLAPLMVASTPDDDSTTNDAGVRILKSNTYVRTGPEQKGNTDGASRSAHKTKAKFEAENKEVLATLLAALAAGTVPRLNLPFLHVAGSGVFNFSSPSPQPSPVVRAMSSPVGAASPPSPAPPRPSSFSTSPLPLPRSTPPPPPRPAAVTFTRDGDSASASSSPLSPLSPAAHTTGGMHRVPSAPTVTAGATSIALLRAGNSRAPPPPLPGPGVPKPSAVSSAVASWNRPAPKAAPTQPAGPSPPPITSPSAPPAPPMSATPFKRGPPPAPAVAAKSTPPPAPPVTAKFAPPPAPAVTARFAPPQAPAQPPPRTAPPSRPLPVAAAPPTRPLPVAATPPPVRPLPVAVVRPVAATPATPSPVRSAPPPLRATSSGPPPPTPPRKLAPAIQADITSPVRPVLKPVRPKFCPECGTPTGLVAKFCSNCGQSLALHA